jgi:hypothetical protein
MPGTFTVGGTGFVNLNNDAQDDTFYGGASTDKAILLLKGADYLAGSDDGGGVTIQGGSARNSGDNGDVIISSGAGGLSGTGSVSIIADNAVSLIATQISVAGEFTNTLNADIGGSVFADDSTVLVDGVAGKIVGNIENSQIITNTISTNSGALVLDGGIGGTANLINSVNGGVYVNASGVTVVPQGNIDIRSVTSGSVTIGTSGTAGGVTIGDPAQVNNTFYGNVTGDLSGSVFADDSTVLVDGVAGKIVGDVEKSGILTLRTTANDMRFYAADDFYFEAGEGAYDFKVNGRID